MIYLISPSQKLAKKWLWKMDLPISKIKIISDVESVRRNNLTYDNTKIVNVSAKDMHSDFKHVYKAVCSRMKANSHTQLTLDL